MAGAGFVIIFVVAFAGCAIWTMIYLTFAAHYFLTTIVDSSAGIDEVEFAGDVGVILLTHHHFDHSEGARELAERLGCGVRALDPAQRLAWTA